jgi:hypothetical protein
VLPPREWLCVQLADRFGGWPGRYLALPADERSFWVTLLGVEGKVASAYADLASGDEVVFDPDEEW